MKIIFLDIDGVLNNANYAADHGYGGWFSRGEPPTKANVKWDPANVDNLRDLLIAFTEARVVISSTWRETFDLDDFRAMFKLYNLPDVILDKTPVALDMYQFRGREIQKWLSLYAEPFKVTSYIILDDT